MSSPAGIFETKDHFLRNAFRAAVLLVSGFGVYPYMDGMTVTAPITDRAEFAGRMPALDDTLKWMQDMPVTGEAARTLMEAHFPVTVSMVNPSYQGAVAEIFRRAGAVSEEVSIVPPKLASGDPAAIDALLVKQGLPGLATIKTPAT